MAVKVTYEVKGLQEIVGKLQGTRGGGLLAAPIRKGLTTSALLVQAEAMRLVPVDTGNLRRTITHRVDRAAVPLFAEVGTNAPYALVVHEGRKAGRTPPPAKALYGWLRRHGKPTSMAFVVARKIGRKGTKGRPFLTDALQKMRGEINSVLNQAAKDIESLWSA